MKLARTFLFLMVGGAVAAACSAVNAPSDPETSGTTGTGTGSGGGTASGTSTGTGGTAGSGGGQGGSGNCGPTNTLENCGACGVPCAPENANGATCATGTCSYASCIEPYVDCDDDEANGCETDGDGDILHCGGCDTSCEDAGFLNAVLACNDSVCEWTACEATFDDCDSTASNGCEQSLDTLQHCGACDQPCQPANVNAADCAGGTCGYDLCSGAYEDCDGNEANGCEADTTQDDAHCSGCNQPCTPPDHCVNSSCQSYPTPCTSGNFGVVSGDNWVVCEADAQSAWVSSNTSGTYDHHGICQFLGYGQASQWGGSCGDVCGYCESGTSCNAPGNRTFDGGGTSCAPNLCSTVHWECTP